MCSERWDSIRQLILRRCPLFRSHFFFPQLQCLCSRLSRERVRCPAGTRVWKQVKAKESEFICPRHSDGFCSRWKVRDSFKWCLTPAGRHWSSSSHCKLIVYCFYRNLIWGSTLFGHSLSWSYLKYKEFQWDSQSAVTNHFQLKPSPWRSVWKASCVCY